MENDTQRDTNNTQVDDIKKICNVLKIQREEITELKQAIKELIEAEHKEKNPEIKFPMRSEKLDELFGAMAKVHMEIGDAVGTKTHGQYKGLYATLTDYLQAGRGILGKHGIYVLQEDVIIGSHKILFTTIGHESGQYSMSYAELNPARSEVQGLQSYNTSIRKMTYGSVVGISYGDDDDDGARSMSKEQLAAIEEDAKKRK